VVQEACLHAFLDLRTLRDPGHFGAWLLGIVVNLCRMHLRAQRALYAWDEWSGGRLPHRLGAARTYPVAYCPEPGPRRRAPALAGGSRLP
jgi:DNA-directed RNA polymerase specialized sigma24 family protein